MNIVVFVHKQTKVMTWNILHKNELDLSPLKLMVQKHISSIPEP